MRLKRARFSCLVFGHARLLNARFATLLHSPLGVCPRTRTQTRTERALQLLLVCAVCCVLWQAIAVMQAAGRAMLASSEQSDVLLAACLGNRAECSVRLAEGGECVGDKARQALKDCLYATHPLAPARAAAQPLQPKLQARELRARRFLAECVKVYVYQVCEGVLLEAHNSGTASGTPSCDRPPLPSLPCADKAYGATYSLASPRQQHSLWQYLTQHSECAERHQHWVSFLVRHLCFSCAFLLFTCTAALFAPFFTSFIISFRFCHGMARCLTSSSCLPPPLPSTSSSPPHCVPNLGSEEERRGGRMWCDSGGEAAAGLRGREEGGGED
eukprot:592698-Rhodomonas_salina.2